MLNLKGIFCLFSNVQHALYSFKSSMCATKIGFFSSLCWKLTADLTEEGGDGFFSSLARGSIFHYTPSLANDFVYMCMNTKKGGAAKIISKPVLIVSLNQQDPKS